MRGNKNELRKQKKKINKYAEYSATVGIMGC